MARRCPCGKPQVIETAPALEDGTPFPTHWWLTCKALAADVGRLESGGFIAEVNRRLSDDAVFRHELLLSTIRFCETRDGFVSENPPRHPGGGPDRVKCLHAHLAHYLVSGDNPVGEIVLKELSRIGREAPHSQRPCV